jgi:hypothetical protein
MPATDLVVMASGLFVEISNPFLCYSFDDSKDETRSAGPPIYFG